ncbi:MAG: arsenate reductase (glutaredoxin) [Pseudohongiellaceae bacterium]
MEKFVLYHNPRCSKSRAALALLEENDVFPEIVLYLDTPPTVEELKQLLNKLGMSVRDIIRTTESEYEELGLDDETLDEEIVLDILSRHPKLLQRPVLIKGDQAVLGRPPENVLKLINGN